MSEQRTEIKCSDCGRVATVPFKPTPGKPVYCRECLAKHRSKPAPTRASHAEEGKKQVWARHREGWK